MVLAVLVLALTGWWTEILKSFAQLHIYISAAGYLFPSLVLLLVWLGTVFVYDRNRYVTFTAGQIVVHQEVGDMQEVYDTTNVELEKRRSDLFRHVLLGLFSGDVVIRTAGAEGRQIVLPNVLFAAWKVEQVANLMKTRPIVAEQ
jgi:hypothetical protein